MNAVDVIAGTGRVESAARRDLKLRLRRAHRARILTGLALVAPLFIWVVVNFVIPVAIILIKSVDNREAAGVMPRVSNAIASWNGKGLPDEKMFAAMAADLLTAREARTLHLAAKRLNSERPGLQALVNVTARSLSAAQQTGWREAMAAVDERWLATETWLAVARAVRPFTPIHLLGAFDLTVGPDGAVVRVDEGRRLFATVWLRTFWIAAVATTICVVLGYPLAHLIATAPPRLAGLLMVLVLLPFWMSLLVRTSAWLILLQTQGVVNDLAINLRLWSERMPLIHNRLGLYVTMTHILLPYVVLPLQAIMRRIPPSYMRAATSLGASPLAAFFRVYLPLTMHGVGAGALLVFILAIGYYVTPALVGGPNDQMVSYFIAFYTNVTLNWAPAAALSSWLLLLLAATFWMFKALFGLDRMRIG